MHLPLQGPEGAGPVRTRTGELELTVAAEATGQPAQGWDLSVDIDMAWYGQAPARVDLTRTLVRVDGMRWAGCRTPADAPPLDALVLEPGDVAQRSFRCTDIPRPSSKVELRLHSSGTGGTGVVELAFAPAPSP